MSACKLQLMTVQVLEEELGKPVLSFWEGGSIPAMAAFKHHLGAPATMFAFGLDDNRVHAPNER